MARPITLITGASAGLGAEFARQCAARGDELVIAARRLDRLEALAQEIGGRVHVIPADLAAPGGPEKLLTAIAGKGLTVDTLINNAGFGLSGAFANLPQDRQREMIDLNIGALTLLCHRVLPEMKARGKGAILNVASTGAFQPGPYIAVYFATKAYVLSFSEGLHQELKGSGIGVTALCPGPTRTEFSKVAGVTSKAFERFAMSAEPVVRAGLAGLAKGEAVVIPGLTNKVTAQAGRFIPRGMMRRIVARIKL